MYTCANCKILACASGRKENMPKNCPMKQEKKWKKHWQNMVWKTIIVFT